MNRFYVTTPIYYVNDRPHIGHCYTTLLADVIARMARLIRGEIAEGGGDHHEVFFLTGTDEHAEKVVTAAAERGLTPMEWADTNAAEFKAAFAKLACSNDDFIRTTEDRHTSRVGDYIKRLQDAGDVYVGDYKGWYDPGQEEYVTDTIARDNDFKSPVTGRPLVERTEKNYFFRLSAYAERLREHIEANPGFIRPEARRNEVLGRIRQGLQDVPISRAVSPEDTPWGILMPDDPGHRIYVWIDALFNYMTAMETPERRDFWPANVHVMAKDILWFHAVIWPCMMMALGEGVPGCIYAHSYWIREGRKMSKSLGNFIEIEQIDAYCDRYGLDAFRWYLITQGPNGATDADFVHDKFVEVYNADLANGIGNATSRVGNMIAKYFDGALPDAGGVTAHAGYDWPAITTEIVNKAAADFEGIDLAAMLDCGTQLVRRVDGYINATAPFKLAKQVEGPDDPRRVELGAILYHCAEALRIASLLLSPALPHQMGELWQRWACAPDRPLAEAAAWAGPCSLKPGTPIEKGDPLFMRADPAEAPPTA
jgi:methionyl-tRNA synthetase